MCKPPIKDEARRARRYFPLMLPSPKGCPAKAEPLRDESSDKALAVELQWRVKGLCTFIVFVEMPVCRHVDVSTLKDQIACDSASTLCSSSPSPALRVRVGGNIASSSAKSRSSRPSRHQCVQKFTRSLCRKFPHLCRGCFHLQAFSPRLSASSRWCATSRQCHRGLVSKRSEFQR